MLVRFAVYVDNNEISDRIPLILRECYPGECDIRCYTNEEDLLNDKRLAQFDAFFIGVNLQGLNGMEIAESIRKINRLGKIIFITQNNDLAHKGYIYNAFRYVRTSELNRELGEALESLHNSFVSDQGAVRFKGIKNDIIQDTDRIMYFEAQSHIIIMKCEGSEKRMTGTMNLLVEQMRKYGFIRIHKSFLVNKKYIASIRRFETVLKNGQKLPISRNYFKDVLNELGWLVEYQII